MLDFTALLSRVQIIKNSRISIYNLNLTRMDPNQRPQLEPEVRGQRLEERKESSPRSRLKPPSRPRMKAWYSTLYTPEKLLQTNVVCGNVVHRCSCCLRTPTILLTVCYVFATAWKQTRLPLGRHNLNGPIMRVDSADFLVRLEEFCIVFLDDKALIASPCHVGSRVRYMSGVAKTGLFVAVSLGGFDFIIYDFDISSQVQKFAIGFFGFNVI